MVDANILVTGAAGYIGGSIVAAFHGSANQRLFDTKLIASVRSAEQFEALRQDFLHKADTSVIQLNLSDESSLVAAIREHNINIIIHSASSINPALAKTLITALAEHQTPMGTQTHFIHTSALSGFSQRTGWPEQEYQDTDDVFGTEKALADSFPVRKTDVAVIEHAKALGVKSYIVIPPTVYGRGTGAWNQLSVLLPVFISTALERKKVSKFPENTKVAAVHISDLVDVYDRLLQNILVRAEIENGEKGYYFALGHDLHWHDIAVKLASAMKARGLVTDDETGTWTNTEEAAEALGVPALFVQVLWNSGSNVIAQNEERLGWKQKWTEEEFYAHIDDEIDSVVELGQAKSSLIDSLRQAARG